MGDPNVEREAALQAERALFLYVLLVVVVTLTSWVVYNRSRAYDLRPLFSKTGQFDDLVNYVGKTEHLYHRSAALGGGLPVFNYPPPAAFVYKALLHSVPGHPVRPYLVLLACCSIGLLVAGVLGMGRSTMATPFGIAALGITAAFGYPLWFTADRGNLEGVAWGFAAFGLCFVLRARYGIGAVLIGLASTIKPFPILFLGLLLRRRRYKEVALGLAVAGATVLSALIALGPNPVKAYRDLTSGVNYYSETYINTLMPPQESRFAHSMLDGMKSAAMVAKAGSFRPRVALGVIDQLRARPGGWPAVRILVRIYPFVVISGVLLLVWVFHDKPLLNQLTALGVTVTLFPPSAGDYSLLQLYVPFGAFVVFLVRDVATGKAKFAYSGMLWFAVIYGLLFAPSTLLMVFASDGKLLLLLALLVVAARYPMRSPTFWGDSGSSTGPVGSGRVVESGSLADGVMASATAD